MPQSILFEYLVTERFDLCFKRTNYTIDISLLKAYDYGTIAVKRYTAKITRCTVPCITVVRPVPSDKDVTSNDNNNNTVDFASIPKVRLHPVIKDTNATAGMVKPMLANAEPSARLRLVCNRFARAA